MTCNCLDDFNEKLKAHNTEIGITFSFGRDGKQGQTYPHIMTKKIEPKKRVGPALAIPTFCPFCGVRYRAEEAPS